MKKIVSLFIVIFVAVNLYSQDTLPKFTIFERGNKVIISWTNPFENLVQLNVQRSFDSLKFYATIFSAPSPELPENGYTDTKQPANRVYYRIFYVMQGGTYGFSHAKRASGENNYTSAENENDIRDINNSNLMNVTPGDRRTVTIKIKNIILKKLSINAFHNFRDSILHLTKDTLFAFNDSLVGLSRYTGSQNFKPSPFIYVNKDGYINISVPSIPQKKYRIKFFEENGVSLFEINNLKESPLIIDKSNFVHAGWFWFELYEDNILKEKNKLYLPRDF